MIADFGLQIASLNTLHKVKTMSTHYDAAIIGSGQAGTPLATALAKAGRRTVIIERAHIGGTCVNEGCTPTKTMVASARVAHLARRGADYGVQTGAVSVDMAKVRERKRAIVASFRGGSERRFARTDGLDVLMGAARFIDTRLLDVALPDGAIRRVSADLIFINVGTRAFTPPLPGLDTVANLDSTTIMELDSVPDHLLVLGGGYIGLEFGQMFRRFGSQVTIVQRGPQLLGREDPDIAVAVAEIMREDGITVLLEAEALAVAPVGKGVQLTIRTPQGEQQIIGSHLLTAVGRTPNSDQLNLGAAGVQLDERGFIQANERLETNVPGIYALGDVNGGPASRVAK
jgi:pyruvate/2-oxoglutarate dehydrogenase complex dihydrolipoamide dehydrogenase (E3) component